MMSGSAVCCVIFMPMLSISEAMGLGLDVCVVLEEVDVSYWSTPTRQGVGVCRCYPNRVTAGFVS
jgi:hypothetical protein